MKSFIDVLRYKCAIRSNREIGLQTLLVSGWQEKENKLNKSGRSSFIAERKEMFSLNGSEQMYSDRSAALLSFTNKK